MLPLSSSVADELVLFKESVLDTPVGEHPHTLAVIIIVLELSNVILSAREENSSIPIEFVVLVVALVNLVIVENLSTYSVQKITSFLELADVYFVWEFDLLELKLPFLESECLVSVINDFLNTQWLEFFPIFNGLCRMLWINFWE